MPLVNIFDMIKIMFYNKTILILFLFVAEVFFMSENLTANKIFNQLQSLDNLIKNHKFFNDKDNKSNLKNWKDAWKVYDDIRNKVNLNDGLNLKNISILCNKDGELIDNEIGFAVNLVRIFVKNHLKQFNEDVSKNESIVSRTTKNVVKKLFSQDEIELLNKNTANEFIDKCLEAIKPNLELPNKLKELREEKVNNMITLYKNNWGKIPPNNDFKLFSVLWGDCQKVKEYINEKKDNPGFKQLMPILYKQDGALINLDKKYDLAMNFFRQFVLARNEVSPLIGLMPNMPIWVQKFMEQFMAVDIREFFTDQELIELGGDNFIKDCYKNAYGENSLQYIPKKYLTLEKESSYFQNIVDHVNKFGTFALFLIAAYAVASAFLPVLLPALPYVATVLGATAGIGSIGLGWYVTDENRAYNESLNSQVKGYASEYNQYKNPIINQKDINKNNGDTSMIEMTNIIPKGNIIPKEFEREFNDIGDIGVGEDEK